MDLSRLHHSSKAIILRDYRFGFTLIEVLIVTAIVGILTILAITALPRQMEKARDGQRKTDLRKIKVAFEHFYSDNDCYPSATVLQNCGGIAVPVHELSPYLQDIPCDPLNESYYLYAPHDNPSSSCTQDGFRVWAKLEKKDDSIIRELNCGGADGCGSLLYFGGPPGSIEYNYGVSEGVPVYYN